MRNRKLIVAGVALAAMLVAVRAAAQEQKLDERAKLAAGVLANLVADPKNAPPNKLLQGAECIAAVPKVSEAAFVVGGKVGYGLASCRVGNGWSLPTYMALKGGSVGLQVGGQSNDVVLIFPKSNARDLVSGSNFEVGAQASVAAGPVGSTIGAQTDFKQGEAIYSYSTKGAGLFAGVSLAGTQFEVDHKGNRVAYPAGSVPTRPDKSPEVAQLLRTRADGGNTPAGVKPFVDALNKRIGPPR